MISFPVKSNGIDGPAREKGGSAWCWMRGEAGAVSGVCKGKRGTLHMCPSSKSIVGYRGLKNNTSFVPLVSLCSTCQREKV